MILNQAMWRCAALLLSVSVLGTVVATEVHQGAVPLSLTDAAIARRYQRRCETVLSAATKTIVADPTKGGSLVDVAVALSRGEKRPQALARLAKLNEPTPVAAMFWMYPMAAVMVAGHDQLDAASWARIQELWRTYWPARGDTENHWVLFYSSLYLAAQTWPDAGPEKWFNGKSSAENMREARAYLEHWIGITVRHGQGEYDSPSYIQEYLIPLGLLAGWAHDDALRQKARMLIDYILYDYAVENVDGWYGGAHSRVYPKQIITQGRAPIEGIAWLLFGFGDYIADPAASILAMSGYQPPPILERIARDRDRPYVERELKRTRWRERNAGPESFQIYDRRTAPVYKYSYVDRDFVLGSSQGGLLQPIQQQTWSLIWRTDKKRLDAANTFFGLQPYSSPYEGTMYFGGDWDTVTDLIVRSKADYDTEDKLPGGSRYEQVFQQGGALIALYDMPADNRFPHIVTLFTRDLTQTTEDSSGWIFAQGGPVYIAYRPLAPGVWKPSDWTGTLRNGAGGVFLSGGFKEWGTGHRCYVSDALRNGYVVQVAPVREFKSYADFQHAVRALPLTFSTQSAPEVTFTSLDGRVLHARYGDTPSVDGQAVDYAHWPLFDSPFAHEVRESARLKMHHGDQCLLLDFKKDLIQETTTPSSAKPSAVVPPSGAMADKEVARPNSP